MNNLQHREHALISGFVFTNIYMVSYCGRDMKSGMGTRKIFMTVSLVVAGICGVKAVQEIAIIKYAVIWHFLRLNSEFALEVESYVYPRLLFVSVGLLAAGMLVLTSLLTGMSLFHKSGTSTLVKVLVLVVAVVVLVLCSFFSLRYIQDILSQPSFMAQPGWGDLSDEYEIHIASKVWPVAVSSLGAGLALGLSFGFLRGVKKSPSREPVPPERAPREPERSEREPEPGAGDLDMLRDRLAKGEINIEEYDRMRHVLESENEDISPLDIL